MPKTNPSYWPSARHFTEAIQCPAVCFSDQALRETLPAVDHLGMPLVTSGQFAYVFKLKTQRGDGRFAVRCFRGYLGDRDQRYKAIEQHIGSFPLSFLSGFTYARDGILVGGDKFPIIFMKWIEGPTLDLYLEEMLGRREVILHMAQDWLKVAADLRNAGIAHGDLQHGNIIVEHGKLRLVDHDGIFVPEMSGWPSSELGHQHYQHPRRKPEFFEPGLDNFSAIVIYLSLISLAEQPTLWKEYHDENLIFRKSDFLDPGGSSLFAQIKKIGPEHARISEALEAAATTEPTEVPYLTDLVVTKSTLPSWMSAPFDVETKTKTREAIETASVLQTEDLRWRPRQAPPSLPSRPAAPQSTTFQTIFGGPATAMSPVAIAGVQDPSEIWLNTRIFAKELLKKTFLLCYWASYCFIKFLGFEFFYSVFFAVCGIAAVCLTYGFIRAQQFARASRASMQSGSFLPPAAPSLTPQVPSPPPVPWIRAPRGQWSPISITADEPIIANRVLGVYHLRDCAWVAQIALKNQVGFSSLSDAESAGYKPCHVCAPVH